MAIDVSIIANKDHVPYLRSIMEGYKSQFPENFDHVVVVQVELVEEDANAPQSRKGYLGLEKALTYINESRCFTILVGFEDITVLADDLRFQAIMSFPNSAFCPIVELKQLMKPVREALQNQRPVNEVPLLLQGLMSREDTMEKLKTGQYFIGNNPVRIQKWYELARRMLGNLSDGDLHAAVDLWSADYHPFAGQRINAVFCEAPALMSTSEQINPVHVNRLIELSRIFPVNIWTTTNVCTIRKSMRKAGMLQPVFSVDTFKGTMVDKIYSGESEKFYKETYQITTKEFIKW